ncbi:transglycosylase domain-containing protein [Lutimonas halocynthiae]|uniref:penicillin-binding protein 1A n=1 Tax=Lutimonas halocynthiae TaxID=1446477 RepID=UPI0025B5D73E|nr:transglycosylase domain-containing protein [Lutimonas halocynthiae]MDN3641571.1 transglycosylase domain-containing protein [Lutimonas halocynthiae]
MAQKSQKQGMSKFSKWIWRLFLGGLVALFIVFMLAALDVFGTLPTFEELENPENNLATEVISIDGETLGKYYRENRTPVKFSELPDNLIEALIATEDERFYEHSGIDFQGTARAAVKLGRDGGASTITQQLAKMLFTKTASGNIGKRLIQKVKEYVISLRLEKQYTKNEIITMYLNKYDFGHAAVGIRSASRIYFGKEPYELSIDQSAMLVGMLKNSSLYNPMRREELVTNRRNVVLGQMVRNEFLTEQVKDSLQKLPLELDINLEGHSDGTATYFREYVREFMRKWMKENPKTNGESYNIYRDGLKIYVTLDSRLQKNAEEAMSEHMANLQRVFFKQQKKNKTAPFYDLEKEQIESTMLSAMKRSDRWRKMKKNGASEKEIKASFYVETPMKIFSWKGAIDTVLTPYDSIRHNKSILQAGVLSTDPTTGHVKAWVGGINYKYFQYDHVKQGKRQVGSTFKPFVYATAINQLGLSPCDEFPNTPYTIPAGKYHLDEDWTPRNSGDEYGGLRTLKNALANSINVISANLIDQTTPQNVVRMAKNLGVETDIPAVPSVALGTVDLSLYEMIGALNTFANKGMYVKPMMILRIEDKNGTILEEFMPETKEVLSESIAYTTINLMEGVTRYGSGVRLRTSGGKYPDKVVTGYPYQFNNPIAGKTGTTQNQSDGWFIGLVPNLSTGVWVGAEDRAVHFADLTRGQGATMALPIWALYMKKNYTDEDLGISTEEFEVPENLTISVDCDQERDEKQDGDEEQKPDLNEEIDF